MRILVFAGTQDGSRIARIISEHEIHVDVCVATAYGEECLMDAAAKEDTAYLHCHTGRLTTEEMEEMMGSQTYVAVIDATHPFATQVSSCIQEACNHCGLEYIRFSRESSAEDVSAQCIYAENVEDAAARLTEMGGKRILFTTGSKDIRKLTADISDKKNLFVRVLPAMESLRLCQEAEIPGKQIVAMQGPFSVNMNLSLIRELQIELLVTKESGATGGYPEKLQAAAEAGIPVLVIRNPEKCKSYDWDMLWTRLKEMAVSKKSFTVIGIGPGDSRLLTEEARNALQQADILFGAERMLSLTDQTLSARREPIYQKEKILAFLEQHPEYRYPVLLCSGDVGFYSGAAAFQKDCSQMEVRFLPGISSMVYFCSRLGVSWQDVAIASIHGREANVIGKLRRNTKVFVLVSGKEDVVQLCNKLTQYHMEHCQMMAGFQLSTAEEQIFAITPRQDLHMLKEGLYVLLLQNDRAGKHTLTPGISDDEFIRGKVPMTKEEVREVSIAKLHLYPGAVLYDIGAGTGSVSIETALLHDSIKVYAIEKNPEAVALLRQNKIKFAADHLEIIEGTAPEAFDSKMSVPTHAFIGGSSGNLATIVTQLLEKNPRIRIVINTVTLETLSEVTTLLREIPHKNEEVTQLSVAKTRQAGTYHLMQAANPVMIISFEGDE